MINRIDCSTRSFNIGFGVKFKNFDGTVVDVPQIAIDQAKEQSKIRCCLEKNLKEMPYDPELKGELYFTMFSDGKCYVTKDLVLPLYSGRARGFCVGDITHPMEISANRVKQTYQESSDECGRVRAYGNGAKFATVYSDGDIAIKEIANEIFKDA